ncbi:squalene/phytoene synthase family protein [Falsirhodobacter sp. alg1]|uniref:phytoene/squalene synthase family protein n=1 Tax=Falsirhodobacter sp. alg1 TaxID=1472418 RepID=UPI0007889CA2|nr:squalene/phytoene synthase family protein [Falsirhodobacter sp. alg1]
MTLDACAELVARGDVDRFATVMAAPVWARARLLPLYAFNIEVSRAPWVSAESMIAEMRLQWWQDVAMDIGEGDIRAHEVASPLADLVTAQNLPKELLADMAEARRWDIYRDPFASVAEFDAYLDRTSGHLMWLSALALGADAKDEPRVRATAWAGGLAALLRAVPELRARGRQPLPAEKMTDLASRGLMRLRDGGGVSRRVAPALWTAWQAKGILQQAQQYPERVEAGTLQISEARKRGGLLWRAMTGRP